MSAPDRHRLRGDRGAYLIVFALFVTSLLAITALVIDLGVARQVRRTTQAQVDAAGLAAGYYLAGNGSAGLVPDPRAACKAAVSSLRTNVAGIGSIALSPSCDSLLSDATACSASTPVSTLRAVSGPTSVTIQYPVPDADIARAEFSGSEEDPGRPGVGAVDGYPCERMRIEVSRRVEPVFGGAVGWKGERYGASTVVRGSLGPGGVGVPALLLLERTSCAVLQVSGNGGIHVAANDPQPGIIHSDSSALPAPAGPCSSNNNSGGWSIYGTTRPSSSGGGPSIIADGTGTRPGRITSYALNPSVNGRAGAVFNTSCRWDSAPSTCSSSGLSHAPARGKVVSRGPADLRYNGPHGGTTVASHHAEGWSLVTLAARPSGWGLVTGSDCSRGNVVWQDAANGGFDNWFVECATFSGANVVFRGRQVVFTGKLDTPNGSCSGSLDCANYVAFPNATRVWIRGCASGCTGASNFSLRSSAFVTVNTGEVVAGSFDYRSQLNAGTPPASWRWVDCLASRLGPGAGGSVTAWTSVATFGGPVVVANGTMNLCQTSVYAGEGTASYVRRAVTTGGSCTTALPCPTDSGTTAAVNINSGSAPAISWTAPNQGSSGAALSSSPFEDLALWTEASGTCTIAGQGALRAAGVFFYPNCRMQYGGQTDNANPLNAQFIGRTLDISGQGVLKLRPSPKDGVLAPVAGDVVLIR